MWCKPHPLLFLRNQFSVWLLDASFEREIKNTLDLLASKVFWDI